MSDTPKPADTDVRGWVADGFEKVAEVLASSALTAGELGVGVHATIEGETVVDLSWGEASTGPWSSDTMVCVYSCTKGLATMVAQLLVDRGQLDVEERVGTYWPEFAVNGKEDTLVAHVLNHTAGVLTFPRYWEVIGPDCLGLADAARMAAELAPTRPVWVPGTAAGYHALTFGWLLGEIVRRVDGRTIGQILAEDVIGPRGLDAHIGLPEALHPRVADSIGPHVDPSSEAHRLAEEAARGAQARLRSGDVESLEALAFACIFLHPDEQDPSGYLARLMNEPTIRSSEIAAGNAIATAEGLCKAYVPLALGGGGLFTPASTELFSTPRPTSDGTPTGYGLGYAVYGEGFGGPGVVGSAFGHSGAGGNIGLADPTRRLSYAYVKNRMLHDPEASTVPLRALYTCL